MAKDNRVHARVSDEVAEAIERLSNAKGCSTTEILERSVLRYLDDQIRLGEVPRKHVDKRDLGFEFLSKIEKLLIKEGSVNASVVNVNEK